MPFGSALGNTVEGTFDVYSGYAVLDSTRPLRWAVNQDRWVQLSGWVRVIETDAPVNAGVQNPFGGNGLAGTSAQPPGIRDFVGATIFGPMHYAVFPDGQIYYRPSTNIVVGMTSWFSFDGCFYRL